MAITYIEGSSNPSQQGTSNTDSPETSRGPQRNRSRYLDLRAAVLSEANPHMLSTADTVVEHINQWAKSVLANDSPNPYQEPSIDYQSLMSTLPQIVRDAWLQASATELLVKAFGWNFERFKQESLESEEFQLTIGTRFDLIDGQLQPYPVHTHIDVVLALLVADLKLDPFTLALAATHDSFEQGRNLLFHPGHGPALEQVSLELIEQTFQQYGIGSDLALATGILTEASLEELISHVDCSPFREFVKSKIGEFNQQYPQVPRRIEKLLFEDQLVYGGLALQIESTCKKLCSRGKSDLAESILAVEIADRLSDIATIEGDFEWLPITNEFSGDTSAAIAFSRAKTLRYIARMQNMQALIGDCAELLPEDGKSRILHALTHYRAAIEAKVEEIDGILLSNDTSPLGIQFVDRFFREVYKPGQEQANNQIRPYIERRADELISRFDKA